jgi:hypothetical protein
VSVSTSQDGNRKRAHRSDEKPQKTDALASRGLAFSDGRYPDCESTDVRGRGEISTGDDSRNPARAGRCHLAPDAR